MTDGNTPQGTALSADEGIRKISALFSTPPAEPAAQPEREKAPAPKPEPVVSQDEPEEVEETLETATYEADDSEDDQDAPQPEAVDEPVKYRLSDGTEVTVDEIEDWRRGTLRQSDYTRKTQEVAKEKKATDELYARVAEQKQFFEQTVPLVSQMIQSRIPQMPDPALFKEDPLTYLEQKEAHERAVSEYNQLQNSWQMHQQRLQHEQEQTQKQRLAQAREQLFAEMPELKDDVKLKHFTDKLVKGVQEYGLEPQVLNNLDDVRMVRILKDAIAYRELRAAKPQALNKAKDATPVQQPGKRASPAEAHAKAQKDKLQKLRKTGDRNIGQSLIKEMLERSSR